MKPAELNQNKLDARAIWQQVCTFYQQKSVQTQCLQWQNEYHANVNLLLILAILQTQNYQFTEAQLNSVRNELKSFSEQTTGLIRKARFNWQNYPENPQYQEIKQTLLGCELAFEQQEQALIIKLLNQALSQNAGKDKTLPPASWYFKQLNIEEQLVCLLNQIEPD